MFVFVGPEWVVLMSLLYGASGIVLMDLLPLLLCVMVGRTVQLIHFNLDITIRLVQITLAFDIRRQFGADAYVKKVQACVQ